MSNPAITTPVYIIPTGTSYHPTHDCVAMGKHGTQRVEVWSLKRALDSGKRRCRLCSK